MIKAELILGGLEAVFVQRWPSTATSVWMPVPAGHQVVKKARSPSLILRRIKRPRVHSPDLVSSYSSASRSASSQ